MDKNQALQNLLDGTASEEEVNLLRQLLASGEISIGRDVNRSVVIIGSGNKVELTAEALGVLEPENTEPVEGEPPYMGMRYFDTADAGLFFGRESLTRELAARVEKEPFLAIVGASGSGKSSVARAGLIPALGMGAAHILTPTAHPLESLAASLTRESESVTATATLMDDLQNDSRSLRLFVCKMLASSGKPNLLLLVDQFEETFTLCKDAAERKAFIENLLAAVDEEDGRVRIVLTLRADFYHHCAEYEGLRLVLEKHQAYIGAMTPNELREAITAPAQKNGWDFQPGLVDLILGDVGAEPGALPLLSHALLETWKRRQGRTLTLGGYADAGGVKKAITQTAENVYDHLTPAEQIIARSIFLRLTELGEGVQDTRRRVKMDELAQTKEQDSITKVLKTLADARLVTTEEDSAEVAHEALIREWGTLRKWLDEDRESLRLHRHLAESAQEWEQRGKETDELYRGARLKQLQDWVKEHGDTLSPLEKEFIRASQVVKKLEQIQWIGMAFAGVALLTLVILGITGRLNRFIYRPVDMENYWVTIPSGKFLMGSSDKQVKYAQRLCEDCDFSNEQPQHWVHLSEYKIGKYEVTNAQYNQCIRAGVCTGNITAAKLDHPVVDVNWYAADAYCKWIGGRLPTEAEWEKAASWDDKAGVKSIYPWGDVIDCSFANHIETNNNNTACVNDTTPVGSYMSGASAYGLYDMSGNVWEWVGDWYDESYYLNALPTNPLGPASGDDRVLRGGSWDDGINSARSTFRNYDAPSYAEHFIGFRCVQDVP